MTEPQPTYHTGSDSGDETRAPLAAVLDLSRIVAQNDAAYWQAQAATAIRAMEQAIAERDTALRQVADLTQQVCTAESRCTALRSALNRANAALSDERRAAAQRR